MLSVNLNAVWLR